MMSAASGNTGNTDMNDVQRVGALKRTTGAAALTSSPLQAPGLRAAQADETTGLAQVPQFPGAGADEADNISNGHHHKHNGPPPHKHR